jgi:plastocyanin
MIMDTLDSRSLRYINCFAQKFSTPGHVHYRISTLAGACLPLGDEGEFIIDVKARSDSSGDSEQHDVQVRRDGNKFVADPPHLEIHAGDMVLWNTADPGITGYVVVGKGSGGKFDSSALNSEAVFTHAFGTPGEYKWVDANKGKISGVIHVRSLDPKDKDQCQKWLSTLERGALITIAGDSVSPEKMEILTGQTVFWAVQKASGISITDSRLVSK